MSVSEEWFDSAFDGDVRKASQMLQDGFPIDVMDNDNRTALHIACCEGHIEIVRLLIRKGARLHVEEDRWGNRPLKYAIMNGHNDIRQELQDAGATLHHNCCRDLEYKLCRSAADGNLRILQMLIDSGISVNTIDYGGRSLLYLAAANGKLDTVDFLLSRGALPERADMYGMQALDVARMEGHRQIEEALLTALEDHRDAPASPTSNAETDVGVNAIATMRCSSAPAGAAGAYSSSYAAKRRGSDTAPCSPKRARRSASRSDDSDASRTAPAEQACPELWLADADVRSADAGAGGWGRCLSAPGPTACDAGASTGRGCGCTASCSRSAGRTRSWPSRGGWHRAAAK